MKLLPDSQNSKLGNRMGDSSRPRLPEGIGIAVSENSGQTPFHLAEAIEPSLQVEEATKEILYGLHGA